ncbi:MAG: hypothetical protein O3A25_19235 [Acidobacteria bacterium]|nr:hypothetical protein [Acidobacteriota bacterium]
MGQVFRATETKLKRQVAIKILPPALAADADRLAREGAVTQASTDGGLPVGSQMMINRLGMAFAVLVAVPTLALGQAPATKVRGFVSVNGGYQVSATEFRDGLTFRENAEDGRLDTVYTVGAGPSFDVAGGVLVWRQLGVGVAVSRFSRNSPAAISRSSPHPFFFASPRGLEAEGSSLTREELAVHVQARGVFQATDRLQLMVFGGPSFFGVTQHIIDGVEYIDVYPYDDISLGSVSQRAVQASKVGFNVGADVAFFFARQIGVGGSIQFGRGTVDLPALGGETQSVEAGGVQAGGGLRLRF